METTKLRLEEKLKLRQVAITAFAKTFDFLQLKDPRTYFEVSTLGESLTVADINQAWEDIRHNQQRILQSKKLKHRNFGTYATHNCGIDTCPIKGVMFRQNSNSSPTMHFHSDHHSWAKLMKAGRRKQNRKAELQIIAQDLAAG